MEIVERADVTDLDETSIQSILSRLRGTTSEEEKLSRIHITDKQGRVLFAGLLVTGKYPQQFYPRLVIDLQRMLEPEKQRLVPLDFWITLSARAQFPK